MSSIKGTFPSIAHSCFVYYFSMTHDTTSYAAIVLRDELKQRCVIDSFIHSFTKQIFVHFFLVLYSVARLSRLTQSTLLQYSRIEV